MLALRNNYFPSLFEEFERTGNLFQTAAQRPPVDVYDDGDKFVVTAELPGIDQKELDIEVADNTLTVKATRSEVKSEEGRRYHLKEIGSGSYSRSIKFGVPVNAAKVKASYHDGVLEITLPKEESIKPKKIKVATA